jgi:hypothetical protein
MLKSMLMTSFNSLGFHKLKMSRQVSAQSQCRGYQSKRLDPDLSASSKAKFHESAGEEETAGLEAFGRAHVCSFVDTSYITHSTMTCDGSRAIPKPLLSLIQSVPAQPRDAKQPGI